MNQSWGKRFIEKDIHRDEAQARASRCMTWTFGLLAMGSAGIAVYGVAELARDGIGDGINYSLVGAAGATCLATMAYCEYRDTQEMTASADRLRALLDDTQPTET